MRLVDGADYRRRWHDGLADKVEKTASVVRTWPEEQRKVALATLVIFAREYPDLRDLADKLDRENQGSK